jgi:hypothetical protein
MSVVFRNNDPPHPPQPPGEWVGAVGRTHSLGVEGVGVNSSEDARHCSFFFIYVSTLCERVYNQFYLF